MATCPHCEKKLPFFKVGRLSRRNNTIICKNCDSTLEANPNYIRINGFVSTIFVLLLLALNKTIFEVYIPDWQIIPGAILLTVIMVMTINQRVGLKK